MKKILAVSIVMFALVANAFGQLSATEQATATATIITPISITNVTDMNFGNVAVSATIAGTVILAPGGGRSVTGGCALPPATGTVTAASFTVTGEAGATYTITLPGVAHTITDGTNNMTVTAFLSNPTPTGLLTGGTETLTVGATLNVAAAQAPGVYVSGTPFDVTVNYN